MYWLLGHITAGFIVLMLMAGILAVCAALIMAAYSLDYLQIRIPLAAIARYGFVTFLCLALCVVLFGTTTLYFGWQEHRDEAARMQVRH